MQARRIRVSHLDQLSEASSLPKQVRHDAGGADARPREVERIGSNLQCCERACEPERRVLVPPQCGRELREAAVLWEGARARMA